MKKIRNAGIGKYKLKLKAGFGRFTVYRKNPENKPFHKRDLNGKIATPLINQMIPNSSIPFVLNLG